MTNEIHWSMLDAAFHQGCANKSSDTNRYTSNCCSNIGLLKIGGDMIEVLTIKKASSHVLPQWNFYAFFISFNINFILSTSLDRK